VDVDEGKLGDDFTGRTWGVTVSTAATEIACKEKAKEDKRQQQDKADDELVWSQCKEPKLKSKITGLSRTRLDSSIARLLTAGRLTVVEKQYEGGKGAKLKGTGYQAVADHADHADHAAKAA
jgi:hypothetical protein